MRLERYLDGREVGALGAAPVQAAEYQGSIDKSAMARAFELLSAQYPVIRARIRGDKQGYLLYVPPGHHPAMKVLKGDEATVQQQAQLPWNPTHALAKLQLIHGEDQGYVALRTDHAIANAGSFATMFRDLWRFYTDIVNGSDVCIEASVTLPRSPVELFCERWDYTECAPSTSQPNTPLRYADLPAYKALQARIQLTEQVTSTLIEASRTHKTSVHGLVCGAILATQRNYLSATREPIPMTCLSAVALGKLVHPPVEPTESTNFHRTHRAVVDVAVNSDPVSVGQEIKAQLNAAIERRQLLAKYPLHTLLETPLESRFHIASVSNFGTVGPFPQPTGVRILDWRLFGREVTALVFPIYVVYRYGGQLNILCSFPAPSVFAVDEVTEFVNSLSSLLRSMGECCL